MESNHLFGDLHHCRLVGCGMAIPRSAIELYSGNITPTRLRHPVGKHPRWCRCKEINSSFHTLPLMISGKTTLTSFNSVSSIVSLAESIPPRGGYFFRVPISQRTILLSSLWKVAESDRLLRPNLILRIAPSFSAFSFLNIHCFRSLFKTSDPRGWLEIILKWKLVIRY